MARDPKASLQSDGVAAEVREVEINGSGTFAAIAHDRPICSEPEIYVGAGLKPALFSPPLVAPLELRVGGHLRAPIVCEGVWS